MSREVLILREPEIRALLDPQACIAAMEQPFAAYSRWKCSLWREASASFVSGDLIPQKAQACAGHLAKSPGIPACNFAVTDSVQEAVEEADLVITVTASRKPLVRAAWLKPGVTVIAVGSDAPLKQELDVDVLGRAGKIVADSIAQCLRLGEIHHAVEQRAMTKEKIYAELGEITAGLKPGRTSEDEIIVCDLTGVGVQDVAAASLVLERAKAEPGQ